MRWIAGCVAGLVLVGCAEGEVGRDQSPSVSAVVDEAGGTVGFADGRATLFVPAGALSEPVELSLHVDGDGPQDALSVAFDLTPDGQQFLRPVELSLAVDGTASGFASVATFDEGIGDWVALPSIMGGGEVVAQTTHFSRYVVIDGDAVPLEPLDDIAVVPGTRVQVVSPTWQLWETDTSTVQLSGTASPDGTGTWTGHANGVNTVGSFEVVGGQFEFDYDVLSSGGNLSLGVNGSWQTVDIRCVDGCEPATGTGTGGTTGPALGDFGCAMQLEEEVGTPPVHLSVAGNALLSSHTLDDSQLYTLATDGTLVPTSTFANETSVHGDGPSAYTLGFSRLTVFDIDGASQVIQRGRYDIAGDAGLQGILGTTDQVIHNDRESLVALGNLVFIPVQAWTGTDYRGGLVVVDVSNRDAPVRVGALALGDASPYGIETDGSYLFVLTRGAAGPELLVVDVWIPDSPVVVSSQALPENGSGAMALSGTTLLYAENLEQTDTGRLRLVDVSVPTAPVLGAAVETTGRTLENLAVLGPWVFGVSWHARWVGAFDISSPALPALTGGKLTDIAVSSIGRPIEVLGVNAFIAGPNGTQRLDIVDCLQ